MSVILGWMLFGATTASAQTRVGFNLSGMWTSMYHEDELERTDPGSPAGDYLGIPLNDDDRLRADIIERIMCEFSADLGDICARHGAEAGEMLNSAARLKPLISDGVVRLEGNRLAVAKDSRFLVRSVAAAFDAHLNPAKQLHSRAV